MMTNQAWGGAWTNVWVLCRSKTTDGENEISLRSGKVNRELAAFIPDILPN